MTAMHRLELSEPLSFDMRCLTTRHANELRYVGCGNTVTWVRPTNGS